MDFTAKYQTYLLIENKAGEMIGCLHFGTSKFAKPSDRLLFKHRVNQRKSAIIKDPELGCFCLAPNNSWSASLLLFGFRFWSMLQHRCNSGIHCKDKVNNSPLFIVQFCAHVVLISRPCFWPPEQSKVWGYVLRQPPCSAESTSMEGGAYQFDLA